MAIMEHEPMGALKAVPPGGPGADSWAGQNIVASTEFRETLYK